MDRALRRRLLALLVAIALAAAAPARAGGNPPAEVMAAYIYNFARFVEWPASAFPSHLTPIVLCTPDGEALDGNLMRVHGRTAQNRTVMVRIVFEAADLDGCQLLFVPGAAPAGAPAWIAAAAGRPILTVSDLDDFPAQGGMIGLYVDDNRVHFDINRDAAQTAGLRVSSRLLALSRAASRGLR